MNTIKISPTDDGRLKIRVVSPSERDQSAVVSFDELQELIRATQEGDEAELELEDDDPTAPDPATPVEVDLGAPVEGEPQIGVDAPASEPQPLTDDEAAQLATEQPDATGAEPAEPDDGPSERQGPGM